MKMTVELTDTFGGEANYSWCIRKSIDIPSNTSQRSIIRQAKAALNLTNVRCEVSHIADTIEIRPRNQCTVAFVTFPES